MSLDDVMTATADSLDAGLLGYTDFGRVIGTGGFVDTANQRLGIRHVLPIVRPHDLAQIAIRRSGRDLVRIGDVAVVNEGPQPLVGDAVINTGPGLLLVVEKAAGANTVRVTKGVDEALADLNPGCPASRSTPTSSARPTSSTWRSTTSRWRCCSAACSWSRS